MAALVFLQLLWKSVQEELLPRGCGRAPHGTDLLTKVCVSCPPFTAFFCFVLQSIQMKGDSTCFHSSECVNLQVLQHLNSSLWARSRKASLQPRSPPPNMLRSPTLCPKKQRCWVAADLCAPRDIADPGEDDQILPGWPWMDLLLYFAEQVKD